jgi:hypothetical protein
MKLISPFNKQPWTVPPNMPRATVDALIRAGFKPVVEEEIPAAGADQKSSKVRKPETKGPKS